MNTINDTVAEMKRDWNERAERNAMWYINTYKLEQTDEEFDTSCAEDVHNNILLALPTLTWQRDPRQLRLLEIGCGIGRMSRRLAGIFGQLQGVDVSGEMVKQASERLKYLSNARFTETSGVNFTAFPDGHFDVIFSAYVFQHIPTEDAIVSNIRDAYRVLAPGGVFKFVSSGVNNEEFNASPKNTWLGAGFGEQKCRALARELGAQVISVSGDGSQYCWVLLRKPQAPARVVSKSCQVLSVGRADDMAITEIPSRGDRAILGLRVSGLFSDELDCNQLQLEWPNTVTTLCYAGPPEADIAEAQIGQYAVESVGKVFQLKARVPAGVPTGEISVRLLLPNGGTSNAFTVNVLDTPPPPPAITQYGNTFDGGVDIYTSGPKSVMRVFVMGLEEGAALEDLSIHLGALTLTPATFNFLAMNSVWELTAPLPAGTTAEPTDISVSYQGRQSIKVPLTIKAGE